MDKGEALIAVLNAHGVDVPRSGNVSCIFHTDGTPSMSIERREGLYKCHSCGRGGDVYTLLQELKGVTFGEVQEMLQGTVAHGSAGGAVPLVEEKPESVRPVSAARVEHLETLLQGAEAALGTNHQAQSYIASRGLTEASAGAFRLGLGTRGMGPMEGKLIVPYLGPNGRPLQLRARCIADHDHVGHGKYMGASGVSTRMFNTNAITEHPAAPAIAVTEGELDCISLMQSGILAVGFPGVNSVKPYHITILNSFDVVYVCGDSDGPGREFTDRMSAALPRARAVYVPRGDVNEVLVKDGVDTLKKLFGRDVYYA